MVESYYHEPATELSTVSRDLHRALSSLIEEIEAIDWYQQRIDISPDVALKEILQHNLDEEVEHAVMVLEWLRRRMPQFDAALRTYLFTAAPVTEIEAQAEGGGDGEVAGRVAPGDLGLGRFTK